MRQSKHERAIRAELEDIEAHIRTAEGEQTRVGNKLRELKGQKGHAGADPRVQRPRAGGDRGVTDLAGACALCGVHREADKANCGEPDCPEQDEHGWEFLKPYWRFSPANPAALLNVRLWPLGRRGW